MKRAASFLLAIAICVGLSGQQKRLAIDDLTKWNRITEKVISGNGLYVACKTEPWVGDGRVTLSSVEGDLLVSFCPATGVSFSSDSRFLFFTGRAPQDTIRDYKMKGVKPEEMPSDMLITYAIKTSQADTVKNLKSYKLPAKWAGWVAYQTGEAALMAPDAMAQQGQSTTTVKPVSSENGYPLCISNLLTGRIDTIPFVTEYAFSDDQPFLFYVTTGTTDSSDVSLVMADLVRGTTSVLFSSAGRVRQLSAGKNGDRAAFIYTSDKKDRLGNTWSVYYWSRQGGLLMAARAGTPGLPDGWIINENARLSFGEKSGRLFFGTSPAYRQKDTTLLEEEKANVDIWSWNEGQLHSVQNVEKPKEVNRSYLAVYSATEKKCLQLATKEMPVVEMQGEGDGTVALGLSNLPYQVELMWEGDPERYDICLIDMRTGSSVLLKQNYRARPRFSPGGFFLYWYNRPDSSWYTYGIADGREYRLTTPSSLVCYDEDNDVPNMAEPYQPAGWLKDDRAFLVSDRYDIWSLDPSGSRTPVNITINGRGEKIRYRLIDFDSDNEYIDPSVTQYLSGFNEVTKGSGYYSADFRKAAAPRQLVAGDYRLSVPVKAKEADRVIFTRETFVTFPDVLSSDLSFSNERRITDANPQQTDYEWGTAELVRWVTLDGRETEGVLYKPAGFDPSKKYPMIVNFYERNSGDLFSHRIPEAHRSTIDYHYYTGNGYLVFNPDIHYRIGYPGESAFNCVMPGIMSLIERGFVEEDHIGAQGHSWGGYQTAYLATRTDLFAAIESGAPVVNMFSAYGGIRWESGQNRSMQYEHQQSRIGATIWDDSRLYFENSPLFFADRITTPVLIMSNDQDGAVPWWQGIEFFIAMRRLGKPAWLLNYCGEPHWPMKIPNKVDFQKRMSQFFGHYLKEEPMPDWMKDGIPAVDKDFETGY